MESIPHARNAADDASSAARVTAVRMPDGVLSKDGAQSWALTGVTPTPARVAHVRREAHLVLRWWSLDELSWVVEQLLSELAGNVVRHAGTPYDVTMTWDRRTLCVSVRDASTAPPQPHAQVAQTESEGRGLLLVTRLATRWGWEPVDHGKVIWFELVPPPIRPDGARSQSSKPFPGIG